MHHQPIIHPTILLPVVRDPFPSSPICDETLVPIARFRWVPSSALTPLRPFSSVCCSQPTCVGLALIGLCFDDQEWYSLLIDHTSISDTLQTTVRAVQEPPSIVALRYLNLWDSPSSLKRAFSSSVTPSPIYAHSSCFEVKPAAQSYASCVAS